jgi:hypothetical protein
MKRVLASLLIFCSVAAIAQSSSHGAGEQTIFNLGIDGPVVRHAVHLSGDELAVLAKDDLMREELDQDPPITTVTGEGLEVSAVHLFSKTERDLVVIGSGKPFIGANVGPFWIIRDLPEGPRVVLQAIALSLDI